MRPDLESELFIWRPILEGLVTLGEVKSGLIDIDDISKMNALLDLRAAQERKLREKT